MNRGTEVKVGIVVVVALVLFLWGFGWIRSSGVTREHFKIDIYFWSVGRLGVGAPVRLAGVRVGEVAEIAVVDTPPVMKAAFADAAELPPQAVKVTCRIGKGQRIYDTYEARVQSPLIGQTAVVLMPKVGPEKGRLLKDGDVIVGITQPTDADVAPAAVAALREVQAVAGNINEIMGKETTKKTVEKAVQDLQKALEGFSKISTSLSKVIAGREKDIDTAITSLARMASRIDHAAAKLDSLLSDPQMHEDLRTIVSELRTSAEQIRQASERVNEVLSPESRDKLKNTLDAIEQTSRNVQQITEQALSFASNPENTRNLERTLAAAADAAEKLNLIADNIRKYTADEQRQKQFENILDSIEVASANIASASQQINELVNSRRFMRNIKRTAEHAQAIGQSVRELLDDNTREDIQETLRAVREISANLQETSAELRRLITGTETTKNIEEAVAAIREASENVLQISKSLRQVTDDQQTMDNVRRAVHNVAALSDSLRNATDADVRISEELSYSTANSRAINVVDVDVLRQRGAGITVGMYDVGGAGLFKLQGVSKFNDKLHYTYGIYKDRPGVGLRYESSSYRVRANLYDANLPTLDLKATYFVTGGLKVVGRYEGLGKAAPEDFLLGLAYEF